MIGRRLSKIYEEIEEALWQHECYLPNEPYYFTEHGFRAAIKIFMTAMADQLCQQLYLNDNTTMKEKEDKAIALGHDIRNLIKKHLSIESRKLYK